jgi:hypothetical protein
MARFRGGPRTGGGCVSNGFRVGRPASGMEVPQYLGIGGQHACLRVRNAALGAERLHGRLGVTQTRPRHGRQGNEPAAGSRPEVLACRGTVNQRAWTWSACGPLGPWLTVYSTFWLSARVR